MAYLIRSSVVRVLLPFLVICLLFGNQPVKAQDQVSFGLDWQISGRHAGFIAAAEGGFYREAGLLVDIQRGNGSTEAVKRVASRATTFGFGDIGSLVIARSEGMPVRTVAVIYGRAPYAIWVRDASGIRKPKDLEGKTIGAPAGSAMRFVFPAFAQLAGLDATKVKWLTIDATSHYPMLFAARIDAMVNMAPGWPTAAKKAAEARVAIRPMLFSDYGLKMYGNGLIVNERTIKENPDIVRRFVGATLKGVEYAFQHPEEAAKLLARRYPEIEQQTIVEEIAIVKQLALTDEARANGLGYMSPEWISATRDIITAAYGLKSKVPIDEIFSNEFLPTTVATGK